MYSTFSVKLVHTDNEADYDNLTKSMKNKTLLLLLLMFTANVAWANIVWPALYVEQKYNTFYIIVLNLALEYPFILLAYQQSWQKALKLLMIGNMASCIIGIIVRPLSGVAWEFFPMFIVNHLAGWGTFNPVTWSSTVFLGGLVNAVLETASIRLCYKLKTSWKMWSVIWLANMLSLLTALIWTLYDMPSE